MQLLAYRYYTGAEKDWRAEQAGTERATIINRLRSFDAAVLWEYNLALREDCSGHRPLQSSCAMVMMGFGEAYQNHHVPVWPRAAINFIRLRRNLLRNDERANKF